MMQIFFSGKTQISSLSCVNLRLLSYSNNSIFAAACDRLADPGTRSSWSAALVALKQALHIRSASPFFMHKQRATTTKKSRLSSVEFCGGRFPLLCKCGADDGLHCERDCFLSASGKQRHDDGCSFPRSASSTLPEPCGKWCPNITYRRQAGEFCTCDE